MPHKACYYKSSLRDLAWLPPPWPLFIMGLDVLNVHHADMPKPCRSSVKINALPLLQASYMVPCTLTESIIIIIVCRGIFPLPLALPSTIKAFSPYKNMRVDSWAIKWIKENLLPHITSSCSSCWWYEQFLRIHFGLILSFHGALSDERGAKAISGYRILWLLLLAWLYSQW